jgi:hypothetical protein
MYMYNNTIQDPTTPYKIQHTRQRPSYHSSSVAHRRCKEAFPQPHGRRLQGSNQNSQPLVAVVRVAVKESKTVVGTGGLVFRRAGRKMPVLVGGRGRTIVVVAVVVVAVVVAVVVVAVVVVAVVVAPLCTDVKQQTTVSFRFRPRGGQG